MKRSFRNKIETNYIKKEAKKLDRKELEEYFIESEQDEREYVREGWRTFALVTALVAMVSIMFIFGLWQSHQTNENAIELMANHICKTENEELTYTLISERQTIIRCDESKTVIKQER